MERKPFETMSLDELWRLHTVVNDILAARLVAKKEELERRLGLLNREDKPPNL
ncbi:DNA-binding protein H-NS [Bradyrhizobium sp. Rc3b]|nr:DNA-binding protein H-NS [Bradyrhizobium sp. SBR1B]NYG46923.1 DNA-binding protein H-NS [Bradyrhizobium sp. IAR9]SFN99659.1 DNA-binding protein H-NS [Bradyrhizobium sp. Rc3b]